MLTTVDDRVTSDLDLELGNPLPASAVAAEQDPPSGIPTLSVASVLETEQTAHRDELSVGPQGFPPTSQLDTAPCSNLEESSIAPQGPQATVDSTQVGRATSP